MYRGTNTKARRIFVPLGFSTFQRIALLCGQIVPEPIHNPVAIKLLVSGLLTRHMLYTSVFTSWHILYWYFNWFRASLAILTSYWQRRVSCMRQGMFTLSGTPSTTSHLDINILSILHYLGRPLGLWTLIFDLTRNIYIHNACTHIFIFDIHEKHCLNASHKYDQILKCILHLFCGM